MPVKLCSGCGRNLALVGIHTCDGRWARQDIPPPRGHPEHCEFEPEAKPSKAQPPAKGGKRKPVDNRPPVDNSLDNSSPAYTGRDAEKRRAYMREKMRQRRQAAKP